MEWSAFSCRGPKRGCYGYSNDRNRSFFDTSSADSHRAGFDHQGGVFLAVPGADVRHGDLYRIRRRILRCSIRAHFRHDVLQNIR